MDGVVTESLPVIAVTRAQLVFSRLAEVAETHRLATWTQPEDPEASDLAALAAEADAMVAIGSDPIDARLIDAAPRLRIVALASVGYDQVDVGALASRGVVVTNTPGVLDETTADLTWALILGVARRLVEAAGYVSAGEWAGGDVEHLFGRNVHGSTIGIIGYGRIGRAVARRAAGFDVKVQHWSRTHSSDEISVWQPLDTVLETSDFVTVHVPLTLETRGLIGEGELRLMRPDAILINTSRGPVVDTGALVRALSEGWIGGAGLDVVDPEPLADRAHPLLTLPNCIVVPHIGSATRATRSAMVDLAVSNVLAVLAGSPPLTPIAAAP